MVAGRDSDAALLLAGVSEEAFNTPRALKEPVF
jgi:hypothetical protein